MHPVKMCNHNIRQNNFIKTLKRSDWFVLFMLFTCSLFFIFQNINNRFWLHDFEVYYSATQSFINGKQVYGVAYGLDSGFYKYSPFALLLFSPLYILPFYVAKTIHFFLLTVAIISSVIFAEKLISKYMFNNKEEKRHNLLLFLILLPLLPHIYTELHLGNINTLLLLIFISSLYLLLSGKEVFAGILMAIGILIKPHFVVFLALIIFRKKIKCATVSIASIVAALLLPSIFIGINENILILQQWVHVMISHNNSLISGQDTIYSWLYISIVQFIFPEVISSDKLFFLIVIFIIATSFLAMLIFHVKKESVSANTEELKTRNFIFEYFLLLAIIPSITKTDSEHFLLSIPIISFLISFLFRMKGNMYEKIAIIFALFLFGMNIRELMGRSFSSWLTVNGILGLANILIILLCVIIYSRWNKLTTMSLCKSE